ncbi:glycosyltransferase [Kineosporia sp. R_H_3]|uniref:glycosyltransferase family 2 protein n=1 Tax=Kineosporia sp. R_H_3 TaxID=1961848 RepID=UPI000B4B69B7|nr:cellulose synthase catalytic subunit [Kineosporia sp. R_H_3]
MTAPATTRPVRGARRAPRTGEPPRAEGLPAAPSADERYLYLGPQARVYPLVQGAMSLAVGVAVVVFFGSHAQTAVFVAPAVLTLVAGALSTWSTSARRRVELDDHRELVAAWRPARVPSVDVFLPTAGEPVALLRNTYEHVARLSWPGELAVLVLDDSGRPEVERLAGEYGFTYLSRPDRGRLKKAGNLAHGYAHSAGDHILVLDADFCPAPDALRELVPYLDDPQVGIVQSPQYFDSLGPATWLERGAGAVQELFYRWVQPARDGVGAAICVGTNAVYRRAALEAAGGFAQIGHSEDVHTGVAVLRTGSGLRYVPVLVARGLCPDGVAGFVSQQYRWCTGSMSLLADRGFHNAGLPLRQRVCFWTGFLYYITTGINVFAGLASAVVMLWVLPEHVSPLHYLPLVLAVWVMFAQWRRVSWAHYDLNVLRVRMLYSVAHALAVWHALTGRTQEWVPTGAATRGVPLARSICRLAAGWFVVAEVGIWTGVVRGLVVDGPGRFWLSAILGVVGTAVLGPVVALVWPETGWPVPVPAALRRRAVDAVAAVGAARRRRVTPVSDLVTWPEALAVACVFGLVLLVSGGLVDALLPVVGP